MKWRTGVYAVCPWCLSKRVNGETLSEYTFSYVDSDGKTKKHVLAARRQIYQCGSQIIESEKDYHRRNNLTINHYLVATHLCPAAMVTFSKALTMIANYHDLSTLTNYETCELIAEKTANYTSLAIHQALRSSPVLQDKFRLPPIPLLGCHVKLLAKNPDKK